VRWDEVEAARDAGEADVLRFEAPEVIERVEADGDLFAPVEKLKQKLPKL
jgi:bifunctional non-homologous end joining protein LigD